MRLLIDSHVALWWLTADPALGSSSRSQLAAADEVYFSVVTPWELGIERALGKLSFPDGLTDVLVASGMSVLPITARHADHAPTLPRHHADPFDRMLIAQAQLEALHLMSADRQLRPYEVTLIDARI